MPTSPESKSKQPSQQPTASPPQRHWFLRAILWLLGLAAAGALALAMVIAVALSMAYPNLPDVSELADYRPKLPLRVYSAEGALLGEFGEERRTLTPINEIPKVMVDAVLAIEDTRFFEHGGVDYKGMLRAALANLGKVKSQGASTITMQVARNVYLSTEKTYTRKIYEVLLTFKLEHLLSKEKILEIYMNQIFLGHRAYGFAAASEVYFGKPLKDVTIAEAAMLAGLPKAPSAYNPISNPKRARIRQLYIIERMAENGFITQEQASIARDEPLQLRNASHSDRVNADYVAEMARQLVYAQYGDDAYTRGLNVYTTLNASEQEVAYASLRKGIMDYERRQRYRGPEKFIALPNEKEAREDVIDDTLAQHPDNGNVLAAVVLEASTKSLTVQRPDGETLVITGDGLKPVESGLSDKAAPNIKIRQGAVIRVIETAKGKWSATQLPEVEGAFVAVEPRTGAIRALVGGFDFQKNKFNHVTQAWRQPGSSFKPFIFSAALEKGISPATMVNDAPLFFGSGVTGGQPWEPRNYDNKFEGPMSVRTALAKSRNIPSIRVLDFATPQFTQEWITRFGFDANRHPAYLTMALGAGAVTPMQMATAFSVFANGGYRINPWLISKITDHKGRILSEYVLKPLEQQPQVIEPRNAFVMNSMLQTVAKSGTAARAQATLKRPDLYGKTGTTNDAVDAWFAGFQPSLAAITWIGYDNPRNLGSRETGGGLSLPIWISFMQHALKDVPVATYPVPAGVVNMGGEWYFDEFAGAAGVNSLGMDTSFNPNEPTEAPPPEERSRILDLFRN